MSDHSASSLPLFHMVGFTGHRFVVDDAMIAMAIGRELEALNELSAGDWNAISSAAEGTDQMFAREAMERGMAWSAVLPLDPAEFKRDFSEEKWAEVETLLQQAQGTRVIESNGTREEAYMDCGLETVNACDVLIAVWDGQEARGLGGTADVVSYAAELKTPTIIIDARSGESRRVHFDQFRHSDAELDFLNAQAPVDTAPSDEQVAAGVPDALLRFQAKTDAAATANAPHFRRLIVSTVLLHVIATIVAAAALAFHLHWIVLPWIKLLCLVGALGVARVIHHYRAQHNWVRCRLAAEIARAAIATWHLPRRTPLFAELDLPSVRQLLRSLHILNRRANAGETPDLKAFRERYGRQRIDDQLAYYRRQLSKAQPLLKRLRLGFSVSTIVAIVATAIYAVHHTLHLAPLPGMAEELVFYFLPIVLPVIAAAFMAFVSINDLHRRVARYHEMIHTLEAARRRLAYSQTWHSVEQVVRQTERTLLQEVLEWHTLMSHLESH
ncbi:hypothetical protein [Actomonas aquatica]|uniref:SMODS and SLOG-associating 2TM effector domain-containing protein n=1 Tax=Actomonas aquatica TaxID=2866162 RepID=A0ABZ1C2F3_9BACT|nr:hypothetical protein [Opitutus sp. WL0086]WRQ85886.1 hypothetical protein K1X11_013820 [Opitutus sp. WL0086]